MRILFVEDDVEVRFVVADALRGEGFEVLEAANGGQALEHLTDTLPIDLLFTDIQMPGINGWELARQVRAILPDVAVFYATGYADGMHVPVSGSMLFNKPYRIVQVISCIHALISDKTND